MKHIITLLLLTFTLFANIPSNTYDPVGNLKTKTIDGTSESYTYNANDQLTQKGSITYTYDANGNLIDDGTNSYEYDDKNRLVKVTTPTDTIEYSYDAQGHRIAKTTSNGTTTYLIDANTPFAQVITETKENGTQIKYTYGNDLLSDGSHSFLTDALGSTRALVDGAETLTDNYNYTPYGELLRHTGSSDNSFLFTGEQYDPEAGLYYLRARYYDPAISRFLSRDTYEGTLTDPLSQNPYLYARGNPVLYVDPSGHMSMLSVTNTLSAMSSLVSSGLISLGVTSGILFQLRANKIFAVHVKHSVSTFGFSSVIHEYINVSGIRGNPNSYRYDVGSMEPLKAFMLRTTEGFIMKREDVSYGHSFVRLSLYQFEVWERLNYRYGRKPIVPDYPPPGFISAMADKYHLLTCSCWTWSYSAWLSAVEIMLTIPSR